MPPITIVIPTLNAARDLPGCLAAIAAGSGGASPTLVISDGGSTDGTVQIARAAGAQVVAAPPGRGGQMRRAAEALRAGWILFLHADTHLPANWHAVVRAHVAGPGGPAVFRLRFRAAGLAPRIVAGWANLRSRAGLPYGDQGLLVSAAVYHAAGGFADLPLMEDVEIWSRLPRPRLLPAHVTTSAERYLREGWLRRSLRNGWTLARYGAGVSPERLKSSYDRVRPGRPG